MAKLDEMNFDPKAAPDVDMENLPEEFGEFAPPPYPGAYTFQLPHEMDFETFKAKVGGKEHERVRANFDAAHPLIVLAATPENADEVGKMVTMYRISNAEFQYKRKEEKITTSEMAFLLKGGFSITLPKGASNQQYAEALNAKAGESFGCEVQWEAYCNPDKKRWVVDSETGTRKEDNADGCARQYAQSGYTKSDETKVLEIPKETGEGGVGEFFCENFPCECGAAIRVRPRLKRYGPVVIKPATA